MRKGQALVSSSNRSGGVSSQQDVQECFQNQLRAEARKDALKHLIGLMSLDLMVSVSLWLFLLSCSAAHLSPCSLYHITLPGGLPYSKSRFVAVQESSFGKNVKETVQQAPPLGPWRGKTIGEDTGVCAQSREGACLGNQTSACNLRVYYQAGQAQMRKTLDRGEKNVFQITFQHLIFAYRQRVQIYTHTHFFLM